MTDDIQPSRIFPTQLDATRSQQIAQNLDAREAIMSQEETADSFQSWIDEGAFNPVLMARRFQQLEIKARKSAKEEEAEKAERKEEVGQVERIEEVSDQYHRKNPELQGRSLLMLRSRISQKDSKEEILRKVLEIYPDYSLADEALDFLLDTSHGNLAQEIRRAKEDLNVQYGREVKAGKNIAEQAREFSKHGLGSPTGLRNLYREVTGNPRDANTLFNEFSTRFAYDKMKTLMDFLLHSLGSDLKSKGPSIDPGELHRLLSETRKLQAILGIFRFFKSRMNLILSSFERQGVSLPARMTFEFLAKLFMRFLQERYPSGDKALMLAKQMGLSEEIIAQIIVYTQMRDAVRGVAPRLYKSDQHRQDVLNAYIDAIEELDDKLEEEEEEEEEEEKKADEEKGEESHD